MNISRKHLPRRTFLKGLGAAISLPMLDAMLPAVASAAQAAAVKSPNRLAWAYVPNGVIMEHWLAGGEGASYQLGKILQPFEKYRKDMMVVSGLGHETPRQRGEQQQQDAAQNNDAVPAPKPDE